MKQLRYELDPRYDTRKSFYGKAIVIDNGLYSELYSYGTKAASTEGGKATVYNTQSPTTLRHVKEFLKQNGFKADTLGQILRDYGEGK